MKPISLVFALLSLCFACQAPARAESLSGIVKLIVGFAPGGGNDILARLLAENLAGRYKASFIVENRPGANGIIAIDAVKRAEPDGRTLLIGPSSAMIANPILLKNISYDPIRDFAPVAMVGSFPLVIVVKADSPIKTLADLVAAAKSRPGELNFSSAASSFQLATEAFMQRAGIKMQNVPYKGSAPAATAVLSNDVSVNFGDVSAVLPLVQGGQMRALAVTTRERIRGLPDTPTVAESGYPEFEMVFWSGLFLPVGVPEAVRTELERQVKEITATPAMRERMGSLGMEPSFMPGADFQARMKRELETYRQTADAAGITPQ